MSKVTTIPGLALDAAARWPDAPAIIDGDRRLSFAGLVDAMRESAAAYIAAGLKPGERVGLWASNSYDWIIACLGLHAAGGVLVPLNTRFKGEEVQFILNKSSAAMLVVIEEFLGTNYPAMLDGFALPKLRRMIRIGNAGPGGFEAFLAGATDAARAEADRRLAALSGDEIADIMFTSGTTGEPKGVLATHAMNVHVGYLWPKATTLTVGDKFMILWPFFHCAGYKAGWVACLCVGAAAVPEATLDVARLVEIVDREKITFLPGPPTVFQTLLTSKDFDPQRIRSVRVSVTGAASVSPALIEAMRNDLQIQTVLTGYGLTETCGTVTMSSPSDPPEIVTTSCGRVIDGIELKIVDADGQEVPTGEAGELLVRGLNVMKGYLDDPEATAEAIEPDGWLHTGDIGTIDAQGYVRITDRKKDVYITGGFNCYPAEIERMLAAHPAVHQLAVMGVPDERMGEVGKAFIVLKPGAKLTSDELIAWSRERMANFKVPRYVEIVEALPTNATGKVQKFKLGA